jgi:hypothetical protein
VQRRGTVRAELASLSDKLEVVVHDVQAEPAVASQYDLGGALPVILIEPVSDADSPRTGAIRFLGLPAGYEFRRSSPTSWMWPVARWGWST